jgi:energy-coupling factor transporter ATP-binding protein EcfA2
MRNVILGYTGAGKTTYMATMYGTLRKPAGGFTILAVTDRAHHRLLRLHRRIRRGEYPKSTEARGVYRFKLCHDGRPVLPFTWVDYRGGALYDTASSTDLKELCDDIRTADSLLVFCAAEQVPGEPPPAMQVGRINTLLLTASGGLDREMPFVVVLTKSDKPARPDPALDRAVAGLRGLIAANERLTGTVVRVACGPDPRNVALPLLFVLRHGLTARLAALRKERQGLEAEAHRHARERREQRQAAAEHRRSADEWPIWNAVLDFFGEVTDGDRARWAAAAADAAEAREQEAVRALQRKIDALAPLEQAARALDQYLADLDTF